MKRLVRPACLALALAAAPAGCGGAGSTDQGAPRTSGATAPVTTTSAASPPPRPDAGDITAAEHPRLSEFPSATGRTLQALAATLHSSAQFGAATGTFTPGRDRLAFAVTDKAGGFIYAPTVVYVAKDPNSPASGPFLAPADPVTVPPRFRSRQNSGPGGIRAVYAAQIPLLRARTYVILAVSRTAQGLVGSPGEVAVARRSPIPGVGQQAPRVATDTLASVHGRTALLTTRLPPEGMHAVSLSDVLGHRPVALLFSTPQLCTSRVCGPVTDVLVALEPRFRRRIAFIHQEVYVDNNPRRGLRRQMHAYHLQTEPWLFTIDRRGRIVDRLEGTFGVNEVRRALEAALR